MGGFAQTKPGVSRQVLLYHSHDSDFPSYVENRSSYQDRELLGRLSAAQRIRTPLPVVSRPGQNVDSRPDQQYGRRL